MRRIPIDLAAFVVIAILVVLLHRPFGRYDFALCDHTALFHYGGRAGSGAVFADGPLPAWIDGGWQALVGPRYIASFYAGLAILILRVFVIWLLVRRFAGARTAGALAIFGAIDPAFGGPHHTPAAYTQLFITASALFGALATQSGGASARWWLVASGASAGLVSLAQPHVLSVLVLVVLPAAAVLARRDAWSGTRFLVAGLVAVTVIALLVFIALGATETLLVDSWSRHGVHGLAALADALSGGALVDPNLPWWDGAIRGLGPACAVLVLVWHLLRIDRPLSLGTLAILVPAIWLVLGLTVRYAPLGAGSNLPRLFLLAVAGLAVVRPDRVREWLGVEPLVAVLLSLLPIISDAMTGLAVRGPGPSDAPSLLVGVTALAYVSSRVASRTKLLMACILAVVAIGHLAASIGSSTIPFETAATRSYDVPRYPSNLPRLRGLRLTESRGRVVEWLATSVPAGSSCFVIGHWPALYTVLDCKNPTPIDSTFPLHATSEQLDGAAATLRATPPDFIITYRDLSADPRLGSLADRYELVGNASSVLQPALADQAMQACDALASIRVYRRL